MNITMINNKMKNENLNAELGFLNAVPPFSNLNDNELRLLSKDLSEKSYSKGTLILSQGKTDTDFLYLIKSGRVNLYLINDENMKILKDYREPGDYFGALGIIMNTKANLNVEAVEDVCCLRVPKKNFQKFINTNTRFSTFYLKSFCEKYVSAAHSELRKKKVAAGNEGALSLFSRDIESIIKEELHTCRHDETVLEVSQKMAEYRIGSLLVKNREGKVEGIITDKDLRKKIIAKGLNPSELASSIMTFPVKTISSQTVCFDALLFMLKNGIHHLAVKRKDDIVGMVTSHDILLLQGNSPMVLFREIATQSQIKGLYALPKKIRDIVYFLVQDGIKANNITRIITLINDQILDRILTLLIEEMGSPPVPFCWITMGSEGRKEQTFLTDQDNAIIYSDPEGPDQKNEAREYFLKFAEKAVKHLAACGYMLCKGNIMASNPKWNQSYSEWQKLFDNWIFSPDTKQILHSTIFFDFRGAFGKIELAERLRNHLIKRGLREKVFIHHLARDCMTARPPVSMFKNFILEKNGQHKGHIDLKTKGLVPFVDFARLMSLDNGLAATNTLERIVSLEKQNFISKDFAAKIKEAYLFQMQLRLVHQLNMMRQDKDPDNYINPSELTDIEKHSLKKAFSLVGEIQAFIENYFHLNIG